MQGDNPVSWLMFFTLAATVFIIAGSFIYFLRRREHREIASGALQENGRTGPTPHGAGTELIGFGVLALAILGLLALGYHGKPRDEIAQAPSPVGGTTSGMAQPPGLANQPKPYQPANPAPDTRAAPTSSSTGAGSDNGGSTTDTK